MPGEQVVNLPNGLTVFRIMILPLLAHFITRDERLWAVSTLTIAGLSDVVDGWYARRFKQESAFGKLLDPVADKIVLCVAVLFLVARNDGILNPWLGTLLLAREFFITGLRAIAAAAGIVIAASQMGKMKTLFQMFGLGCVIVGDAWHPFADGSAVPGRLLGSILLWISVVLSYWSMTRYLGLVYAKMKESAENPAVSR